MDKIKAKKRGRKPSKAKSTEKAAPKKRGRKPKGGKIMAKVVSDDSNTNDKKPNIILHLRCNMSELDASKGGMFSGIPYAPHEAFALNANKQQAVAFDAYQTAAQNVRTHQQSSEKDKGSLKETYHKLRQLKISLHNNDLSDKRSGCFWCTCPFDSPPVYIPKEERNGIIEVYGCFCSPECAVAFLKKEPVDSSTLWERYTLLNNVYSKIYNYEKNIKPAPDPYYTLEKYYGNLTIQEYRSLLANERLLLVVDKPLTKVLPDLYEENNELPSVYANLLTAGVNHKIQSSYRLQRKQVKITKKTILDQNFNFPKS